MKKLVAILLVVVTVFSLSGCYAFLGDLIDVFAEMTYEDYNTTDEYFSGAAAPYTPRTELALDREQREGETPMGEPGSWTIFVYLCGADLESDSGLASANLDEMLSVNYPDNIRFVVQTGGAYSWYNSAVNPQRCQRFVVERGRLVKVYEDKKVNMGDDQTLADFLLWGVENYPAENMGVILWNHGGGSIDGVVFDQQFYNDSLTLLELEQAFAAVSETMTDRFEFVGFDACLMATVETANILVPFARYMFASEELEPGAGWDYSALARWLCDNPGATGAALGEQICESYYRKCQKNGDSSFVTLSVIDLSKIDYLIQVFEDFSTDVTASIQNRGEFATISRELATVQSYGGASEYEGYSNIIDLGDLAAKAEGVVGESAAALRWAIHDAVVYQVRGYACPRASGLAVYYPLSLNGTREIKVFNMICVSPAYMKYVDMVAYGKITGSLDNYHYAYWEQNGGGYWSNNQEAEFNSMIDQAYYGSGTEWSSPSPANIQFDVSPYVNDEGYYTFTIAEESLDNVMTVYFTLYYEGGDNYAYIGRDSDLDVNYTTGVVEDNFRGVWPSLPDGQYLTMYILEEDERYSRFTSPVLLNGSETNLRFEYDWELEGFVVLGTWDGIDAETGMSAREIRTLQPGDVLIPIYEYYDVPGGTEYTTQVGREYTVTGNFAVEELPLAAGDYLYAFEICDLFGQSVLTDFTTFNIDQDGELWYYPDDEPSSPGMHENTQPSANNNDDGDAHTGDSGQSFFDWLNELFNEYSLFD